MAQQNAHKLSHKNSGKNIASISNDNHLRKNQYPGNNLNTSKATVTAHLADENAIYASAEKYLQLADIPLNQADNKQADGFASRYPEKISAKNPAKKTKTGNRQSSKIATYAFWQNAAYTGEQGKLNVSFDDRISYLAGETYSACQNNFGVEYAIPKSRFAVGVYHQRFLRQFSLKTSSGLSASAQLFSLGNGYVKAGAGVTYLSSKLFKNNLNFSDQIDAKAGFINTTRERNFTSSQNTIGADAGIWYSSPRLTAGFSAKNINQPQFGRIEEGERLRREWHLAAGYTIPVKNINIMPWGEIKSTAISRQASTMLLVSYKDVVTLGAGYMNISPLTLRGDVMAQVSVEVKQRLRIYGMYGQNMEMQSAGLQQNIVQTGLRYQIQ